MVMRTLLLLMLMLSAAVAQRYEKLAPFDGLRWNADTPEVQVNSTWYRLVSIDGTKQTEILTFCRKTWPGRWKKRFNEDLVEVLTKMGHPPGSTVDLGVRDLPGEAVKTLKGVAMTAARRRALHKQASYESGRRRVSRNAPDIGGMSRERITRSDVDRDLDRLAWRIEHTYSYRDLTGFDWRHHIEGMRLTARDMKRQTYGKQLMKFLARFGDGHTRVGGSAAVLGPTFLPVRLEPLGDRIVALRPEGGGAAVEGHPFVKSIDGVPVEKWIEAALSIVPIGHERFRRRVATGRAHFVPFVREELENQGIKVKVKDTGKVTLQLADATGRKVVTGTRAVTNRPPSNGFSERTNQRIIDGKVGYIRIPKMSSGGEFEGWLHRSMAVVRDTKGLIIDVRGNGGGSRSALRVLLPYFMAESDSPHVANVGAYRLGSDDDPKDPKGFLDNRYLWPAGHGGWSDAARRAIEKVAAKFRPDWKLPAGCFSDWHYMVLERTSDTAFHYERPLIILLDTGCFSATDIFLGAFHGRRNVTLMGSRSGGGSGRSRTESLPGSRIQIRMSSMASFRPNGQRYDGKGIIPDVMQEAVLSDVLGVTDTVLAAAVKRLGH